MFARLLRVRLLFLPTLLLGCLGWLVIAQPAAASPAAQTTSPDYQIIVTKTVGIDPRQCATTDTITVSPNTTVYYCFTMQNTGSMTLTRHTLEDSDLGVRTFGATVPPGGTYSPFERRMIFSATLSVTTTNVVTWTAQPFGYEAATATDSATVYVRPPADTIAVNTTEDEINNDGDCSLREAIIAANTDSPVDACSPGSGADFISLPAGTFRLSLGDRPPYYQSYADPEDASATGDLDLLGAVVIQGQGAGVTRIEGARHDRVLHVLSGASVTLTGLTVQGGSNTEQGGGGGIRNSGDLTLQDVVVAGNTAGDGMAYSYAGGGIWNDGTLHIERSEIRSNHAGSYYIGHYWYNDNAGGIYNDGTLTVVDSRISNNDSGGGSGIANYATATISNTEISGNEVSGDGGGISNYGTLYLYNSIIERNVSNCYDPENCSSGVAGLLNTGTVIIEQSQIRENLSSGVFDPVGGGIYNLGTLTMRQSAVYSNTVNGTHPGGGGLSNGLGTAFIANSTFSGNTVEGNNSDPRGAGIYNKATLTLQDSTVANNRLICTADRCSNGVGGGIANEGTFNLTNSLIAGNAVEGKAVSPDCGGILLSGGANLIGDSSGCSITGDSTGNQTDVDAKLAPLAASATQSGVTTFLHALLTNSPAIDAGSACLALDQRGVTRPQEGNGDGAAACDIGAYERCTSAGDPLCIDPTDTGTTGGAGDPAEENAPDTHELHLPLLQTDS